MSKLEAKVRAVNSARQEVARLGPVLVKALEPFVGKQIIKKSGELLDKVKKALPEMPCGVKVHVYRHVGDYSLTWIVKTCEMIDGTSGCVYHEECMSIGGLTDGFLDNLSTGDFKLKSDYTVSDVELLRSKYKSAKSLADTARNNLYPFDEYDRN